jgi:hypothetical protein
MAGTGGGGNEQRQSIIIVAVLVGLGMILTVGALVFHSHDERTTDTAAASPTTATTAAGAPGTTTTTTTAFGPAGVAYVDPNEIYRMTLGADWAQGAPGAFSSVTWTAPVAGGTARVNPLLSRGSGTDSLPQFVQSTVTRLDNGPLYRTTGTEPTTMADGTPATIVHFESSTGDVLVGHALVVVKGEWGMTMLIQCPPDGADACFAALDPYVKSVIFT